MLSSSETAANNGQEQVVLPAIDRSQLKALQLRINEPDGPRAVETWEFALQKHDLSIRKRNTKGIAWTMIDVTSSLSQALNDFYDVALNMPKLQGEPSGATSMKPELRHYRTQGYRAVSLIQ